MFIIVLFSNKQLDILWEKTLPLNHSPTVMFLGTPWIIQKLHPFMIISPN